MSTTADLLPATRTVAVATVQTASAAVALVQRPLPGRLRGPSYRIALRSGPRGPCERRVKCCAGEAVLARGRSLVRPAAWCDAPSTWCDSAAEAGLDLDGRRWGDASGADLADPARVGVLGEPEVGVRVGCDPDGCAVGDEAGGELVDGAGRPADRHREDRTWAIPFRAWLRARGAGRRARQQFRGAPVPRGCSCCGS